MPSLWRIFQIHTPDSGHAILGSLSFITTGTDEVVFALYDSGGFLNSLSKSAKPLFAAKGGGAKDVTRWVWKCRKDSFLVASDSLASEQSWSKEQRADNEKVLKRIQEGFDAVCTNISFDQKFKWQFQSSQKSGNCEYEAYTAALHDLLHPLVYRLSRIAMFLDIFFFYLDLYERAVKSDGGFAGRQNSALLPEDLEKIGGDLSPDAAQVAFSDLFDESYVVTGRHDHRKVDKSGYYCWCKDIMARSDFATKNDPIGGCF